jgi:DNA-binding winged helix-turn-helix (wHTH) protein
MAAAHISFGPFELDPERGSLLREGKSVPLGHRAVSVLAALLKAQGRTVSKAELLAQVWPGTIVEEGNLTVQIAALRKTLGPAPDGREWIVTVPRVGYRCSPRVRRRRSAPTACPRSPCCRSRCWAARPATATSPRA